MPDMTPEDREADRKIMCSEIPASSCPRCGCPIWIDREKGNLIFTCMCHEWLQKPPQ